nr:hypothetical protein [Sinorhizobium medicae]
MRPRQREDCAAPVENALGEETTIHWHGVAHAMDCVPHPARPRPGRKANAGPCRNKPRSLRSRHEKLKPQEEISNRRRSEGSRR